MCAKSSSGYPSDPRIQGSTSSKAASTTPASGAMYSRLKLRFMKRRSLFAATRDCRSRLDSLAGCEQTRTCEQCTFSLVSQLTKGRCPLEPRCSPQRRTAGCLCSLLWLCAHRKAACGQLVLTTKAAYGVLFGASHLRQHGKRRWHTPLPMLSRYKLSKLSKLDGLHYVVILDSGYQRTLVRSRLELLKPRSSVLEPDLHLSVM